MYHLLVRLMVLSALLQLGVSSVTHLTDCRSGKCLGVYDRVGRKVLHVDWKPISVFPEEAKRFKK